MVEQPLPKSGDEPLDEESDAVIVAEEEKPLESKYNDQAQADEKVLFQFRLVAVGDGIDDVFCIIDRGCGEDIETHHAEQAEDDEALIVQDQ